MKLPRFIQDIMAVFFYLFFGAIEIIIIFGILLACFLIPIFIANASFSVRGDGLNVVTLTIGVALMALWYWFLDTGARKSLEQYFRKITHKAINKVGAGDAIYDD